MRRRAISSANIAGSTKLVCDPHSKTLAYVERARRA